MLVFSVTAVYTDTNRKPETFVYADRVDAAAVSFALVRDPEVDAIVQDRHYI